MSGTDGRTKVLGQAGQTATEFLMISGFMTAVGILVLQLMGVPFRETFEAFVKYMIGQIADPP